jgi:hypothetical protein
MPLRSHASKFLDLAAHKLGRDDIGCERVSGVESRCAARRRTVMPFGTRSNSCASVMSAGYSGSASAPSCDFIAQGISRIPLTSRVVWLHGADLRS